MKIIKRVICLCCFFFNLYAATPQKTINYSAGIGQPIVTSTADTLEKGQIGISQRVEYYSNLTFSDTVLLQHPLAENLSANLYGYLLLSYGLGDNLTIGVSLPYVDNISFAAAHFNETTKVESVINLGSAYGLGDTNIFALSRVLNEDKYPVSLSFISGINAPTGKTTARDNTGTLFAASDQPGSGAWTPFAGIIISRQFSKFSLGANLIYTQGIEGEQHTTLGSIYDYNVATVLELYRSEQAKLDFDGILELNGEYAVKDNIAGVPDPNSGGNFINLLLGMRVNIHTNYSGYLGVNIPIEQNFYGTQVKAQYGITGGIDISV
ncbi:hypothetical protein Lgra_1353 [Legionella gratiana]|uniref:Fe-S protein n=1 Tax=Legionella gratiana TaxID=45066 RepID=A0A378JF91_9GAMM|nr:hypothetical protein [Legionella gratiana]KTD11895.1 hypothetical protein Lgra_1353 [Legionella gratiana]STX46513.1 Uncharacterised protein [Legionella gratiana]